MIEFVTNRGARYRVVGHDGGIGAVVDEKHGIKRTLWSIQGKGFEILYGGHWIPGKLRVKAGRRVVPPVRKAIEVDIHWSLARYANDKMQAKDAVLYRDQWYMVIGMAQDRVLFTATLIPWIDPT